MTYQVTKADIANEGAYLANGLKVIGAGRNKDTRLFEFLACGHQKIVQTHAARDGRFKCDTCKNQKLHDEASSAGLELLERIKGGEYGRYRFVDCQHEQVLATGTVRIKSFKCHSCLREKLEKEAKQAGIKFLDQVNGVRSRYRLLCGHEQVIAAGDVRRNLFKCQTCLLEKLRNEANNAGLELLEKINGSTARYKFMCCGHEQLVATNNVRRNLFSCHSCIESWATKSSNLYLNLIEYGTTTFLKFGRSRNVKQRSFQYGLAVGSDLKILKTWATNTGLDAEKIEKLVADNFKSYPKHKAKLVLQESGYTECFHIEDKEKIIEFVEELL